MSTMDTFYKLNIEVNDEFIDSWPEETCFAKVNIGDFVSARSAVSNEDKEVWVLLKIYIKLFFSDITINKKMI